MTLAPPASSFDAKTFVPSWLIAICSGSDPPCSIFITLPLAISTMPIPSAALSGGGSLLWSTPGAGDGGAAERHEELSAVGAELDPARPLAERNCPGGLVRAAMDDGEIAALFVGDVDVIWRRRGRRFGFALGRLQAGPVSAGGLAGAR